MEKRKNRQLGRTILLGAASVALYAAVFSHGSAVAQFFAQGRWYSLLPVGTVLVFSLVYGAFASNLWSLLGIEARKQMQPRPSVQKRATKRKRHRPQPRLQTPA